MSHLVPKTKDESSLAHLASRVDFYAEAASSEATRRAYASDMRQFQDWCATQGDFQALPANPAAVACYLTHLADTGRKTSTIERALISIRKAHEVGNYEDPTAARAVKDVIKGIRRTLGAAQKKAAPLVVEPLKEIIASLDLEKPKDLRDRALLCLGLATGMRRSELVALDVEDLTEGDQGLTVRIRRSKTDQEGTGRNVVVFKGRNGTCPVNALNTWKAKAGIEAGPVFVGVDRHGNIAVGQRMSDQMVRRIVKERAEAAGVAGFENFSGHSLRAGLATQAAMNGAAARDIAKQTGHRSEKILNGYIREADLWKNNVTEGLGL